MDLLRILHLGFPLGITWVTKSLCPMEQRDQIRRSRGICGWHAVLNLSPLCFLVSRAEDVSAHRWFLA